MTTDGRSTDRQGILLLYHYPLGGNANTIIEHVSELVRHSRHRIWAVNTEFGFPEFLESMRFRAVVLHYSLFGSTDYMLSPSLRRYLLALRDSHKVAFFQDEYYCCQQRFCFIRQYGIDTVYTLVPPQEFEKVYGRYTPGVELVYTLPSFVSGELAPQRRRFARPDAERTVDVGYRGRNVHPFMGAGANEKVRIASEFVRRTRNLGLRLDVSVEESKRLYGDAWFQFLGNCKAVLGVETGVSVFDLDGEARIACEQYLRAYPEASLEEISENALKPWEGKLYYRTIGPRHFEAIAMHTPQILFEGSYSGVLEAGRHYIPLKKDYSNLDEVVEKFRDPRARAEVADAAYADIVESGRYGYPAFVASFDEKLARSVPDLPAREDLEHPDRLLAEQLEQDVRAHEAGMRKLLLHHQRSALLERRIVRAMQLAGLLLYRSLRRLYRVIKQLIQKLGGVVRAVLSAPWFVYRVARKICTQPPRRSMDMIKSRATRLVRMPKS